MAVWAALLVLASGALGACSAWHMRKHFMACEQQGGGLRAQPATPTTCSHSARPRRDRSTAELQAACEYTGRTHTHKTHTQVHTGMGCKATEALVVGDTGRFYAADGF